VLKPGRQLKISWVVRLNKYIDLIEKYLSTFDDERPEPKSEGRGIRGGTIPVDTNLFHGRLLQKVNNEREILDRRLGRMLDCPTLTAFRPLLWLLRQDLTTEKAHSVHAKLRDNHEKLVSEATGSCGGLHLRLSLREDMLSFLLQSSLESDKAKRMSQQRVKEACLSYMKAYEEYTVALNGIYEDGHDLRPGSRTLPFINNPLLVEVLVSLSSAIDMKATDMIGRTLLHVMLECKATGSLKSVAITADSVILKDSLYRTPLHIAAWKDCSEVIEYLPDHLPPQAISWRNYSLIHFIAHLGHNRFLEAAITSRCLSVQLRNLIDTKIDYKTRLDFARFGWKRSTSMTPIMIAGYGGHLGVVKVLMAVTKHSTIWQSNEDGWNALHWAAHHGHHQIVAELLRNNWSQSPAVNARVENEETALHLAVRKGHLSVVSALIQYKAVSSQTGMEVIS